MTSPMGTMPNSSHTQSRCPSTSETAVSPHARLCLLVTPKSPPLPVTAELHATHCRMLPAGYLFLFQKYSYVILFKLSQINLPRQCCKPVFFYPNCFSFLTREKPSATLKKKCCSPIVNNPHLHWLPHPFKTPQPGFTSQTFLQGKQNSKIRTVLDWAAARSVAAL